LGKQICASDGYYSSDYVQVELYLNGTYWGVYTLAEQQQVNENRVDIAEPEEGYQGTDIGYFIEYDGYYNLESYAERFSCNYNYSNQNSSDASPLTSADGSTIYPYQNGFSIKNDVYYDDVNNCAQKKFIKNYIWYLYKICYESVYNGKYYTFNSNYTGLVAYTPTTDSKVEETVSKVMDVRSLVDMYILSEVACDYDLSWSSFFMSVDMSASGDKLLRFIAPWDFDSAFGLRYACESANGLYAANTNNPWLLIFINQSWFQNAVKARWQSLYNAGLQQQTLSYIASLSSQYQTYYNQNFERWGYVISDECVWQLQQSTTNAQATTHLTTWLTTRFTYLNSIWL
jgi:hypothetical protein